MYYLLGKKLSHSYSVDIHNELGNDDYSVFETDSLESFFSDINFKGLNITIPYKEEVIEYLDDLSETAKKTNSVNTILKIEDRLIGYNTDYDGFVALINYHNIDLINKRILILGSGATSRTVKYYLEDYTKHIDVCSRNGSLNYSNLENHYEIVINTTPNGMHRDTDDDLLNLTDFTNLEVVIDLIYNPLRTRLIQSAKCKVVNGLYMLVYQAALANSLFFNKKTSQKEIDRIYNELLSSKLNIVFIGMPMSGKTTIGKEVANTMKREFIDIDDLITYRTGKSIQELFDDKIFREVESKIINSIEGSGKIISTGGGVVENIDNITHLRKNGILVYIEQPLETLLSRPMDSRPLLKDKDSLIDIYKRRLPLYNSYADITVKPDFDMEVIYEFISSKWC